MNPQIKISLSPMEKYFMGANELSTNTNTEKTTTTRALVSANAYKVLEKRYLAKDDAGKVVETPQQLFQRVASNIAKAEMSYSNDAEITTSAYYDFYNVMANLEFLPNSPTLMNAGRELQQLSACFVLPVEDSMVGIFDAIKNAAIIHKSGGGTGFSFSRLRPNGSYVRKTGGVASGPISFLKVFNQATEAVKQGGRRRGANMAILRVDHPDILEFIKCKDNTKDLTNFNISVAITDEFMNAVDQNLEYSLIHPKTKEEVKRLRAREVFDMIAKQAHKNGEPGLFFIDKANATNPVKHVGMIEATNPCGEQELIANDVCNLGSINLEQHLQYSDVSGIVIGVDWEKLAKTTKIAVRFLDNIIDMNCYPLPDIETMAKGNRRIGLGIMGFARMLYRLGIRYDSVEGLQAAASIMSHIQDVGHAASMELAEERGTYLNWEGSEHQNKNKRMRNSYVTTIAPTGTISMIADTSSGCEPEFSLIWYKNVMDGQHLPYVQEYFIEVAKQEGFWSETLLDKIVANHGSVQGLEEVPKKWQNIFVTSHDIHPLDHVKMQAAFQLYVDSAVSKTINMAKSATVEDVKQSYMLAYKLGCKGITVYRDGSREEQVMNLGVSIKNEVKEVPTNGNGSGSAPNSSFPLIQIKPRPEIMKGCTVKRETSCGHLYLTVNEDETGKPFEVFSTMGKSGGCEGSQNEAVARLISLALRAGVDYHEIVKQLIGIRCNKPFGLGEAKVESCSDGVAKMMLSYYHKTRQEEVRKVLVKNKITASCPDCECELEISEGCEKCRFCGYSRCG
jgi:ribonucleoside-diphosphate reductase alpha chain